MIVMCGCGTIHADNSQSACGKTTDVERDTGVVAGDKARQIDLFVRRLERLQIFSGQVLIAERDSIRLNRAYGLADRARCIPVRLETAFDIASLSKQFTGAALMRLVQDGQLSLSDSIGRWLPNVPPDKRGITLEQLSSHTAGIPRELDEEDSDHFGPDLAPARDSVVQAVLTKPLRFDPGTRFEYSNMGFVLLGAIIERAARESFQSYVRRTLFQPAGLRHTGFPSDARHWPASIPAHAYADMYDDGSSAERPDSWRGLGGSQVQSTATGLLTWHRALRARRVLAADPRERLMQAGAANYLLGWQAVRRKDGTADVIFHAGGHPRSFGSEMRFYPARDIVVIVLTNWRHDDVRMQEDVIANVSDFYTDRDSALTPLPDVVPSAPRSALVGTYTLDSGDTLVVWQDSTASVWIAPIGQRAFDLVYGRDSSDTRRTAGALGVRALVDSLSRLRCPVAGALDPQIRTSELRSGPLGAQWCSWLEAGTFSGHRVLGVAPRTYSKTRSLVVSRLRFGSSERTVAWEMNDSTFIKGWSARDVEWPQSRVLAIVRNGDAVLYDWFTSRRIGVKYNSVATDQRAATLQFQLPQEVVTARRNY